MEQIKLFEDVMKRIEVIKQMPDVKTKDQAQKDLFDSLGGKHGLFDKYCDAKHKGNQFIDFNDCPCEDEIPTLVDCLRECGAQHITISSGLVERMWVFCQSGCKIDGMIEINDKLPDWKTGKYTKHPAFLLSIK